MSIEKHQHHKGQLLNCSHNPGEYIILYTLWSCNNMHSRWTLDFQLFFIQELLQPSES